MSSEKTTAIVLRTIDFSETSCVVTLMTRDFGKITAMAKGARRPKGPFEAAIDVLAICRIVFLHKSSGAMDLLTEAKLERRFRSSSIDLNRLYAGYYIIELLRTLTEEKDPHPELFDLAERTIIAIDETDDPTFDLNLTLLSFELGLLRLLGHLPMLTKCVDCGRDRTTQNRVSFGLHVGGLLCQSCRRGKSNVVNVSPEGVQLMIELAQDNWNAGQTADHERPFIENEEKTTSGRLNRDELSSATVVKENTEANQLAKRPDAAEIRQLINQYITQLLGFPPRLHKFLKNI